MTSHKRASWHTARLTVEPSSSWGATSRSVTQELLNILWKLNAHCCVHKSPSIVPSLGHINPIHNNSSYFSKIQLNSILRPMCRSFLWSLSFWLFYQNTIFIHCYVHLLLFDFIILITLGGEYKS
jgi:hypothetical protein